MNKEEFKKLLSHHDDLYYNQDAPEITDPEYNVLKDRYVKLYGEYEYVPGEVSSDLKRVKHTHRIISLDKVNNEEKLRSEMIRLAPFVIEPKLDGLTVVGYPGTTMGHGKFATRGNGEYGEDITHTGIKMMGINRVDKIDYTTRMEAIMFKSTFNSLNEERIANNEEPFKNPRNAAAGMLRNKDASKVKGVAYMAYNIVGSSESESEQNMRLIRNGFITVPYVRFTADQIDEAIDYVRNFDRDSLDYEIDGLVIKNDEPDSLERFGSTGHHPKNAVAYKFPPEGKWTGLNDITWQVGRTGKITPVAELEPIDISGSTILRATLHNESIISALRLNPGAEVFVIKANDVIPAIIECRPSPTRSMFVIPTCCPACNSRLQKINDQLFCENPSCKEKLLGSIVHLAKREALDIEGLSEKTAEKLIDYGIKHPFDIFELTLDDIMSLPGFAKKSAENLYSNIQKARTVELKNFLYAAAIPEVGRSASEDIANHFGSIEAFYDDVKNDYKETREIHGIGDVILENMSLHGHLWSLLLKYVIPRTVVKTTTVPAPDVIFTVVVTGSFMDGDRKVSRNEIEDMIKKLGHKTSGSVSKKTSIVLVGKDAGSKADKAKELGITMITSIDELHSLLS